MSDFKQQFLQLAVRCNALRFGEFTLKSGRVSPYFFNAGQFNDGESLAVLARCYADAIVASGVDFEVLFGPAYKGIPLAAAVAASLYRDHQRNVGFAYDRKEIKDHGEGGRLVGAPLEGRVLIIDDVISAGVSVREAVKLIEAEHATPVAVAIALDRQERGEDDQSAVQAMRDSGLEVIAIARLDDLIAWLAEHESASADLSAMIRYQERYGAPMP